MILDLVADREAGRRDRPVASRDREPARSRRRGGAEEGVPLRIAQRADDDDVASDDQRIERVGTTDEAIAGLACRDRGTSSAGRPGCGRARTWPAPSTSCSSTRPASCRSPPCCSRRRRGRGRSSCSAIRTSCRRCRRASTRRAPAPRRWSTSSARRGRSPPDRGLLLGTTYRLHPDVNAFISDAFYEGRLETDPANARQLVGDGEPVGGTGVRFVPLPHPGRRQPLAAMRRTGSPRRSRRWSAGAGSTGRARERRLEVPDVLVVAPYNAQVAEIARTVERRLGARPNVGTVDKFQGREAPVAIYSMATSTPEDAPRDRSSSTRATG